MLTKCLTVSIIPVCRLGAGAHEQHAAWSHASAAALAPAGPALSDDSIVSLLPSGTEILFALGLGHRSVLYM